jgi:hypothetical protein
MNSSIHRGKKMYQQLAECDIVAKKNTSICRRSVYDGYPKSNRYSKDSLSHQKDQLI